MQYYDTNLGNKIEEENKVDYEIMLIYINIILL